MPAQRVRQPHLIGLVEMLDELTAAKHFVCCLYLACQSLQAEHERGALCAVSNAGREKLELVEAGLQRIIACGTDFGRQARK